MTRKLEIQRLDRMGSRARLVEMKSRLTLGLLVLAAAPFGAGAQALPDPRMPIPSYEGFMTACMQSQAPFRSEVETVPAAAACQCYYEQMPLTGFISLSRFKAGTAACEASAKENGRQFVENYFSRVRNNLNKRFAPPSTATR